MELNEADRLLDPTPMPLELGYERTANGSLHIAIRTDMHGCTGEMFEWWFRWRCDTQKYIWWHPVDHVYSGWQGTLSDDTHVGSEHVVTERFTGSPPTDLVIQFRDPSEFFDADAYAAARAEGRISCAVLARGGNSHDPERTPDGAVIGTRLLHLGRDTSWGMVLRTHFYLGHDLGATGMPPEEVAKLLPDQAAIGLLQHCYDEFTYLSRFLPSLYIAEHRDERPPALPW